MITRIWAFVTKREFTKFLMVGLSNTALSYAVYITLNFFLSYTIAYSIAYVAGFVCSYVLNSKWVFQTELSWQSFFKYPLVYAAQFLINLLCLNFLVERLLISEAVAPLVVIVISIPVTFVLSRFFLSNQTTTRETSQ